MKRSTAISMFGGSVTVAADRLGVTRSAINQWEREGCMTLGVCDHCLAAWLRSVAKLPAMRQALETLNLPADALRVPVPQRSKPSKEVKNGVAMAA